MSRKTSILFHEQKKKINLSYHLEKFLTKCCKALFGKLLNLLYLFYQISSKIKNCTGKKIPFNLKMQWDDHCLMAS